MDFKKSAIQSLSLAIVFILLLQAAGCGTIIYPERRGQAGGRIDAGVAILDGVGLLIFLIPGIIAFGVDFATGAIYLPAKTAKRGTPVNKGDMAVIKVNPDDMSLALLEEILERQTGKRINLNADHVEVYQVGEQKVNVKLQLSMLAP